MKKNKLVCLAYGYYNMYVLKIVCMYVLNVYVLNLYVLHKNMY